MTNDLAALELEIEDVELGGRLWGAVLVSSVEETPFPVGSEQRIADFAQLVAQALANAEARQELADSRARIVQAGDEERFLQQRVQRLDVRASGDLGDHPAEPLVQVGLGGDQVGADREAVLHHRDGRLVARGLDAEGDHLGRTPCGSSSAISRSRAA